MLCLGLESSCDETGLALVADGKAIASVLASQVPVHALFDGVVPELASREHSRLIGPLFDLLMAKAGIAPREIEAIAVARGPGLLGSLLVGAAFAKGLALILQRPLIGVNHLHAHLLSACIGKTPVFPALGLVISGGHTEICLLESPWQITRLGRTLDDAAGEVFDKVGCRLGFSYPAGKKVDECAAMHAGAGVSLPLPYIHNDNLDFSFSGLKTAAVQLALDGVTANERQAICAGLNNAVAEVLAIKTGRALARHPEARGLYVAGGVAANSRVRARMEELACQHGLPLFMPPLKLCGDNGVMIAYAGEIFAKAGFGHGLDLASIPRGRPVPADMQRP